MQPKTKKAKAAPNAAKPKKPVPLEKQFKKAPTINIQAEHRFAPEELQKLGMDLAGFTQKKEEIASHRKELNAQLNAQAEEVNAQIKQFSNKLRAGFEMRATDALVVFDATAGQKTFYRKDNREKIRTEPMLPSDYEQELPMPGLPPSKKQPEQPKDKKTRGKKTKASPAGELNFGDALSAAAAGKELPRVPVVLTDDSKKNTRLFRNAAKKAGWPEAAIKLLTAEANKAGEVEAQLQTLSAHVQAPAAE